MFCYQCEQTARGTACTVRGVCGKDPQLAALQDLLVHGLKCVSACAHAAGKLGARDEAVDAFVPQALFATLTNVNFDPHSFRSLLARTAQMRDRAKALLAEASGGTISGELAWAGQWQPAEDLDALARQGEEVGIEKRAARCGQEAAGLQELIVYGLKGAAAYAYHARLLGKEDEGLYAQFHELLDYVASEPTDAAELLGKALETGALNLRAMELLDGANTEAYGHPEPTAVRIEPVKGKAIVVSGHDLKDLAELLEQTAGTGINVYTHGEMLPAHAYPALKKHSHLVGNYGGAWQEQQREFEAFPGAVLMTTNCLMKPRDSYAGRLFTSGPVGWPGVRHIADGEFAPVIEAALAADGFSEDGSDRTIMVGFARNAVLGVADKVVEAVKSGAIRHFFLIGGCDGAKPGRNY